MGDKNFPLPPVSPLIGSTFRNFIKIIKGHHVWPKYYPKLFLTALTILATSPFRLYEKWYFTPKLEKTKIEKPIFILGHWRSGTTYLHNLMCQDPASGYVMTYQTVFPHFLASKSIFGPFMKTVMPTKRPSDNIELSMNFPQEEELGFQNSNPNSIYNFYYFPEDISLYYDRAVHHTGLSENAVACITRDYIKLLKKALIVSGKNRIVLKNPINTARIEFLNKNFSDAKYIHIVRNPYSVYLSARKFFSSLLPALWFHEVSQDMINSLVLELYSRLYEDYFKQKEPIQDKLFEIRFEQLEDSPLEVLHDIYLNLDIKGFEQALPAFRAYVSRQKDYQKNTYLISDKEIHQVDKKWGKYIKHWQYNIPSNIKVSA